MKYLIRIFVVMIFCFFMLSCKTDTFMSESEYNAQLSQYGDQTDLKQFVADFIKAVETGNRDRALIFFDRDNYLAQASIGIGKDQYLIEGLMLPAEEFIDDNNAMNINHLKSLTVKSIIYGIEDYYAEVRGEAALNSGRKVPFTLLIRRDSKGRFTINPPVG